MKRHRVKFIFILWKMYEVRCAIAIYSRQSNMEYSNEKMNIMNFISNFSDRRFSVLVMIESMKSFCTLHNSITSETLFYFKKIQFYFFNSEILWIYNFYPKTLNLPIILNAAILLWGGLELTKAGQQLYLKLDEGFSLDLLWHALQRLNHDFFK